MIKIYDFDAIMHRNPRVNSGYVEFPYHVEREFGVKGPVKVIATFDGEKYRGSLVKMGSDCHWIGITQEIRRKINKNPGDMIHVTITKDNEPRRVIIPPDFKTILEKEKKVFEYFQSLSFSHQKEYVQAIESAKKVETRNSRIQKSMEMLREKAGKN
jgi:hypothetical protein